MKLFWKSVLIAFILYILIDIIYLCYALFFDSQTDPGYFGYLGGMVFGLMVAYWAYVLVVLIYGLYCKKQRSLSQRLSMSGILISLLYIGNRIPDILDDDFWTNFSLWHLALIAIEWGLLLILWEKIYPKIGSQKIYTK
jgi:small-conductance mechanosensitive channel